MLRRSHIATAPMQSYKNLSSKLTKDCRKVSRMRLYLSLANCIVSNRSSGQSVHASLFHVCEDVLHVVILFEHFKELVHVGCLLLV